MSLVRNFVIGLKTNVLYILAFTTTILIASGLSQWLESGIDINRVMEDGMMAACIGLITMVVYYVRQIQKLFM